MHAFVTCLRLPARLLHWRLVPCVVLLLAANLIACSSAPKKSDPLIVTLRFSASGHLNPDLKGRPSPAQVGVLKLKKSTAFMTADYFTLADAEKNGAGGDIAAREAFVIEPGESTQKSYSFESGETAIGVLVGFRDMEHSTWRASIDLPPPKSKSWLHMPDFMKNGKKTIEYDVNLDDRAVRLTPAPRK